MFIQIFKKLGLLWEFKFGLVSIFQIFTKNPVVI